MTRQAVYTSVIGGYETLSAQPVARGSAVDFLCFTDDPELGNDDWTMVVVTPPFPLDPSRSQRYFKILGHPILADYDELLYIDNSVELRVDPVLFLREWLEGQDAAFVKHSVQARVIDEFDAVLEIGLDEPSRVHEQLLQYSLLRPETLDEQPSWNAIFAYRPTAIVRREMMSWYGHVLRYSRRDQLSWNATIGASDLRINRIALDNHLSEFHAWPMARDRRRRDVKAQRPSGPLVIEIAQRERELIAAERRAQQLEAAIQEVEAQRHEAASELHRTLHTLSWRITAPLRALRRTRP